MEPEIEKNVLQHLLHLESEASALVDGAQAEADKRLAEAEIRCRSLYDKTYSEEVEKLEAAFVKDVAAAREDYRQQLDTYRQELSARPVDTAAFSALAGRLLEIK